MALRSSEGGCNAVRGAEHLIVLDVPRGLWREVREHLAMLGY